MYDLKRGWRRHGGGIESGIEDGREIDEEEELNVKGRGGLRAYEGGKGI